MSCKDSYILQFINNIIHMLSSSDACTYEYINMQIMLCNIITTWNKDFFILM